MRLRTLVVFVVGLTSVVLAGCHDWLMEEPEDFFSQDNFPASEADLKIALGGIDDWYTGGSAQAYFHRGWPMITDPLPTPAAPIPDGRDWQVNRLRLRPWNWIE